MPKRRAWIKFELLNLSASGKTKVWEVVPIEGDGRNIGCIKWFGRWRKYSFFPANETVFETDCLRLIADFCEERTKEQRSILQ